MQKDLVLYHGSRRLFERFDYSHVRTLPGGGSSRLGIGMYWTKRKEKAINAYASMSDILSKNSVFRDTSLVGSILYQTSISQDEQKKTLDLLNISDDILKRLQNTTDSSDVKDELNNLLTSKNRYPDFAIWARSHQDLLKQAGFNCLKEKDIFCFLEPEKLKWSICEAKVLSGTQIPRSLITPESKITIQNKLLSEHVSSSSIRTTEVLGKELLSQESGEMLQVVMPPQKGLKSFLKQLTQKHIQSLKEIKIFPSRGREL